MIRQMKTGPALNFIMFLHMVKPVISSVHHRQAHAANSGVTVPVDVLSK
jgi:hypothetical protein